LFICALVVSFAALALRARAANDTTRAQINNIPSKSHVIPLLFSSWLNWETYVADAKVVSGKQKCFCLQSKTFFFVSEQQNLFPQHMFPARLNWETFAYTTTFPQECFLV